MKSKDDVKYVDLWFDAVKITKKDESPVKPFFNLVRQQTAQEIFKDILNLPLKLDSKRISYRKFTQRFYEEIKQKYLGDKK